MKTPPAEAERRKTAFEQFVSAILSVPKAEADEIAQRENEKPRVKRGPKPKPRPS